MQLDPGWVTVYTVYLVHLLPDKAACFPVRTSPLPTTDSGLRVLPGVWTEEHHKRVPREEFIPRNRLPHYSEDIYFEPTDDPLENLTHEEDVTDPTRQIYRASAEATASGDYMRVGYPGTHIPRPSPTTKFNKSKVGIQGSSRLKQSDNVATSTTKPAPVKTTAQANLTPPRYSVGEWDRSYDNFRQGNGNGMRGVRLKTTATTRRGRNWNNGHVSTITPFQLPRRVVRRGDIQGSGYYENGAPGSRVVIAEERPTGTHTVIKRGRSSRPQIKDFQCPDDYCENNGICTVIKEQPRCACLPAFAGDRCQEFVGGMIVNFSVNEPVFASVRIMWTIDIRYPISGFQLDCYMQGLDYEFKYSVQLDAFTRNFTLEGLHPDVNYRACVSPIADGMVRVPVNFEHCKEFSIGEQWQEEKEKRRAIIGDSAIWILVLLIFLTVYAASRYCRQW